MSHRQEAQQIAARLGISVAAHNPGEGPKVRVFEKPGQDYFDGHCIFATDHRRGWFKALIFLQGYEAGKTAEV